MSREAKSQAAESRQADPNDEFLPSAPKARYGEDFIPVETSGPLYIEDDQINTEWFNPTKEDVILALHIGTDPKNLIWLRAFREASPAKRAEMRTGTRIIIVKAGQTKMIPAEFDLAIQRTHCLHPECSAKKDSCKNLDHPRVVASGLAPQLTCKRWHKVPSLAANLDQARAQAEEARKQLSDATADKMTAEVATANARRLMEAAQASANEAAESKARAEAELERERRSRLAAENELQQLRAAAKQK
jgi:hypothetical protein